MPFWYLQFSQKTNQKFDFTTMLPQVELFSFGFLGELKTPKRYFEINWPLRIFSFGTNGKCRNTFKTVHSSPRRLAGEKKSTSYNHKTTIWVSHEYYLNPEFHKILSRAFWVIVILRFFPYVARVDFKGLISK